MKFKTKYWKFLTVFGLSFFLLPALTLAQYKRTDLVSDTTDPDLVNAWGLTRSGGSPFWVSDEGTGKSTLYDGAGQKQGLVVTIPPCTQWRSQGHADWHCL